MYQIKTYLQSGCEPLDRLLGGGFESGIVTQIFGEAGSGKTNICLQTAIECVKKGRKVIYIDTEAISADRFEQIAGEKAKEIARDIIIYEPTSFEEQYSAILDLNKIAGENIGLIILDSATSFYRYELDDEDAGIRTRRELSNQLGILHSFARKHDIAVIITNQIYTDIVSGAYKPIGGSGIEHISKTIIQLERTGTGTRLAKLWKHRSRPEGDTCRFIITSDGVR